MYAYPGITQSVQKLHKLTGCNVPECWHYIKLFNGKCQCSSKEKDRTGEAGCKGYRERTVGKDAS